MIEITKRLDAWAWISGLLRGHGEKPLASLVDVHSAKDGQSNKQYPIWEIIIDYLNIYRTEERESGSLSPIVT
eukprot:scaffold12874_cov114-Skeletonema_menzelii.AAC.1